MNLSNNFGALSFNPIEGPGYGIAQLRAYLSLKSEWDSELVSPQKLGQIASDLGIGQFSKDDILGLWRIGLLRADCVECEKSPQIDGLNSLNFDSRHLDLRAIVTKQKGYGSSMSKKSKVRNSVDDSLPNVSFHPTRIYVLYHVVRTLASKTSPCQYLIYRPGLAKLARFELKNLDRWTSSPAFSNRFDYWNQLAEVAALCSVVLWLPPEDHEVRAHAFNRLPSYADMVRNYLKHSGLITIRQWRQDLAWAAHTSDENRNIHTLLRLMRLSERERIKGSLGAAMKFLDMAESIRRASERLLNIELAEEDEIGPGQWMHGARKMLYGHERVFDAPRKDLRDFLGILGLDFGVKVRCYVEGETEFGAFRYAIGVDGLCSVVNLKGNVVQRGGRGMAFADSLAEDVRDRVISVIVVDRDREDVVRAVKRAASEKRIHGRFYLSSPDFELANFNIEELLRIAIATALSCNFDNEEVNKRLIEELPIVSEAKSAKEFMRLLPSDIRDGVTKGETWGAALMKYAIAHPIFPANDSRTGEEREIFDAARVLVRAQDVGYLRSVEMEELDPETGKMVMRQVENSHIDDSATLD
ncbi:hypothetical protein [Acidovorax sp. 99]|uniref:hypothetical protein n=1 Tax=Acidovorax sp. 99 TaxID=2135634 RepID=UPI001057D46D|nr:hypothetical protein [Acidovorax sp. 99]